MDRISGLNAVPFATGKNGFRDADRANGVEGTQLNAAWCLGVQESLLRTVEFSGQTPDANNNDQHGMAVAIIGRREALFTTPGAFAWTCPPGVFHGRVTAVGAGGAGGAGGGGSNYSAPGGGAGGYERGFVTLTPGQVYTVTVGAPGVGTGSAGTAGGASGFGSITATGGTGGAGPNGQNAPGGVGGAGTGGSLSQPGGWGNDGNPTSNGVGSGIGGASFFGGGGRAGAGGGVPGAASGSGGGGAYGAVFGPGGNGAPGLVLIEY